ncbi:TonB-dependent receptor [Roseateles sp. DXS20W]|uniref:TonB-dependent receptor n=1 Tax=Pelomonas lactea TaxID=3299030 RepID=A0ABW7GLX4_9BURK
MNQPQRTLISLAAAQAALLSSGLAMAQTAPAPAPTQKVETVVVSGKRAALQSAQKIKQDSDEIVDSIVSEDMGALPDRSVTEVLQRIVGVTIDRTMSKGDPEHYSVEGSGVTIRGLTYVRSELNGRDSFSANGGRALNFEDVPPELMAAVDVYKNPSAEQIEGSIGGLVNLRTALPFDYPGFKASLSAQTTYSKLKGTRAPSFSGLLSNRWDTPIGRVGALISLASSESGTRTDAFQVEPYYPRTDAVANQAAGTTLWIPKGAQWRTLEFDRKRKGTYAALQWKNEALESSLTYFKSKYRMDWTENAIFAQSSPYKIKVADGQFDANGAMVYGTLSNSDGSPIDFGADTRIAFRNSTTRDVGWNVTWKPSERWTLKSDLQHIKAKTDSFDSTVATGVQMLKETLDLRGTYPTLVFDDASRAALLDPAKNYWAFTMEDMSKSTATETAWKGDAKFNFDHAVLQDLRFGLRLAKRNAESVNSRPGYHWAAITQTWQQGWAIDDVARLSNPKYASGTHVYNFPNFFNGKASVPSLIFPDRALAANFPQSYQQLHGYGLAQCEAKNGVGAQICKESWSSVPWSPATFGVDPSGNNDQDERTQAGYAQLRFGFEDLKYPIDGNVGVRVVHTSSTAHGYTVFSGKAAPPGALGVPVPIMPSYEEAKSYENSYTNVLPTLNLRMKAGSDLQYRFALGKGMTRPDFSQMQAYTKLTQDFKSTTTGTAPNTVTTVDSVSFTGEASGNPMLKPIRSTQADLTAEWYINKSSSLTGAVFYKKLSDVILNQTSIKQLPDVAGKLYDFTVTTPINGADGHAKGIELAYQTYFDFLPGWLSGLGMQANYTYVDSSTKLKTPVQQLYCSGGNSAANVNLNLNGCDVDGRTFGNLPLQNLSKNAFNLAFMFDRGPFSARVAYSWRSKYLQNVNVNGTQGGDGLDTNPNSPTKGQTNVAWGLPTWADGFGQVDASVFYKITDQFTVGLEGQNLTDSTYKQLMQQHIGMKGRAWFATGPRYTLQMRYSY